MEQGLVLTIIKQLTALTKTKNQASQITEGKHKLTKENSKLVHLVMTS
jgi:hypothetical protein